MSKKMSRFLAMLLAATITVNTLPLTAMATNPENPTPDAPVVIDEGDDSDDVVHPEGAVENEDGTFTYPDGTLHDAKGNLIEEEEKCIHPEGTIENEDGTFTYPDGTIHDTEGNLIEDKEDETESSTETVEPEVIAVSDITLDETSLEVGVGELPMTLTATVEPENATDKTVTWTSSEPGVVSVDENGNLAFGYMGEAVITATVGEFSASCTVTVGEGEAVSYVGERNILIAMSDYQNSNGNKKTVPQTIVNAMVEAGVNPGLAIIGGDYTDGSVGSDGDDQSQASLKTELNNLVGILQSAWSDLPYYAIQGNHDYSGFIGDVLSETGAYDQEDYNLYVINEDDFPWWQGNYGSGSSTSEDKATVTATAAALETYLNGLISSGDTDPVIIMTHVPLHWSLRSTNSNWYYDNIYANILFEVVNEAAEELDILFLFGHNHSSNTSGSGYDVEIGDALAYVAKGETMKIPNGTDGSSNYTTETLNFTYMNCGYIGKYNGSTSDCSISAIEITDTAINIDRYTYSGSVVEKTIELEHNDPNAPKVEDQTDAATGVIVSINNDKTVSVKETTVDALADTAKYDHYKAYDITLSAALADGETATVKLPATGFTSKAKVYYVNGSELVDMNATIADGYATFTTDHFSVYAIAEPAAETGDWMGSEGSNTVVTAYQEATSMTAGTAYIITNSGSTTALTGGSNSYSGTGVTVTANGDGTYNITTVADNLKWYVNSNGNLYCTVGGTNYYLNANRSGNSWNYSYNLSIFQNASTEWTVSDGRVSASWRYTTRYLTVGNSIGLSNTATTLKFYSETTTGSVTPAAYYRLNGELNQTYDLSGGAVSVDTVLSGVKIQVASDSTGSTVTGTVDVTADMVSWSPAFDGKTAGTYTGTVTYNGYNLGNITVTTTGEYTAPDWVTIPGTAAEGGYEQVTDLTTLDPNEKYMVVLWRYFGNFSNGTGDTYNGSNGVIFNGTTNPGGKATIAGPGGDEYAKITTSDTANSNWWYLTYSNGKLTLKNAASGTYLDNSNTVQLDSAADTFTVYTGTQNGYSNFGIVNSSDRALRIKTAGTVEWPSGYTGNQTGNANACNITIYREVQASSGEDTYARLTGETSQTYVQGATDLDTVLGKVKVEVADSADAASGTEMAVTSDMVTWDSTFNPNVAGTYTGTVKYNGVELGTVTVKITPKAVSKIELMDATGSVRVNSGNSANTGGTIKVTYADGTSETVDVTLGMLNTTGKTVGTFEGLTVTYGDKSVTGFTLTVYKTEGNDYPEYPNEGAVKVDKSATGINFQETGVAKVELITSGIPMDRGVDVVVAIDTSSSMDDTITGGTQTRIAALRDSINAMIGIFKEKKEDGSTADIDIAVLDFNGFTGERVMQDGYNKFGPDNYIENYAWHTPNTGSVMIDWTGIENVADNWGTSGAIETGDGTNFDTPLEQAYDLLVEKKNSWAEGETRAQYVVFMSDGAPYQYNGVYSNNSSTEWNKWLMGSYADASEIPDTVSNKKYYNGGDGNGQPNRWADAIKGATDTDYSVIEVTDNGSFMSTTKGAGATLYAIGFDIQDHGSCNQESAMAVLRTMASNADTYYNVTTAAGLTEAFETISGEIRMAAYNAYYVDQMGDDFNIQLTRTITRSDGTSIDIGVAPTIEVKTYDIYTLEEANASATDNITLDMVGDRKGTSQTLETVTFSTDGKQAFSNGGTTNILVNGVIYANTFWYNTNATAVMIDTNADGVTDYELPSETFYWKIGTVSTKELALSYYVYLEGALEGTREAGSYPTNEYAILYYDNYLDNPCEKPTTSPVMSWKGATVSYAFYLVDENGNIIVNQTTGATGSFANKVAVTNPVVYKSVNLNNEGEVTAISVTDVATTILPDGYELYDSSAEYKVQVYSGDGSNWSITKGTDKAATTYVTGFGGTPDYSNALTENGDYQYTDTTVWFAVLWKVQALPDTVVIDYGLPVDISVLTNDMFGESGKLAGIGAYTDGIENTTAGATLIDGFGDSHTGKYGTAVINGDEIRYTPSGMEMNGYDKFAYAVEYTGDTNRGYYYDTVTVIPATTIYYEDSFVTLSSFTYSNGWTEVTKDDEKWVWTQEGSTVVGATQDEDRPGEYALTDANNIYGYDSVNKAMSTYSMGSAMKAGVDYDNYGSAEFTFYGTGFDVISMTSNTTGMIFVDVYQNGAKVEDKSFTVDTYYGYKQVSGDADGDGSVEDGELVWEVDPNANGSIYQVPVIKVEGLTYGQYTAKITAYYNTGYDHVSGSDSYDFYLDAIRIYDPANDGAVDNDNVIEDAYKADGEGWPSYFELRNHIIEENKLTTDDGLGDVTTETKVTGLVFIDGDEKVGEAQISDYVSFGPNNEVYLAPGQRVAFILDVPANIANVHIGIKSADGKIGTYTITNIAKATDTETGVTAGAYYNAKTATMDTTTDMYYDITGYKSDIIVISNTGDKYDTTGIISLTNVKFTYTSDPNAVTPASEDDGIAVASEELPANEGSLYMTPAAATLTLRSLNASAEEDVPEETEPEETIPETTVPEDTEPEETVPDETKPEEDTSDDTVVEVVERIKKAISWLKGWFGW